MFQLLNLFDLSPMLDFVLTKTFHGNLNETILLVENDVIFKVSSILVNEISSFRFPQKMFHKRKLCLRYTVTYQK